jgi:hypothetical protein
VPSLVANESKKHSQTRLPNLQSGADMAVKLLEDFRMDFIWLWAEEGGKWLQTHPKVLEACLGLQGLSPCTPGAIRHCRALRSPPSSTTYSREIFLFSVKAQMNPHVPTEGNSLCQLLPVVTSLSAILVNWCGFNHLVLNCFLSL